MVGAAGFYACSDNFMHAQHTPMFAGIVSLLNAELKKKKRHINLLKKQAEKISITNNLYLCINKPKRYTLNLFGYSV